MPNNKELSDSQKTQMSYLQERLADWYKRMVSDNPNFDDGEESTIKFIGGRSGYELDDETPSFTVIIKISDTDVCS
jgi:hypothetical protein